MNILGEVPILSPFCTSMAASFSPFMAQAFEVDSPLDPGLPHVADASERLSLLDKLRGFSCVQDDNGLVYEFQGDGADADAGLLVTDAGISGWNGIYTVAAGIYTQIADLGQVIVFTAGQWLFGTDYIVSAAFPWQKDAVLANGDYPVPTVLSNPITSEANWSIV